MGKCEVCRAEHNNSRFCSVRCRNSVIQKLAVKSKQINAVVITCGTCSKEFKPGSRSRKYCSRACYYVAETTDVRRTCPFCSKEFEIFRANGRKAERKFCSRSCASKSIPRRRGYHLSVEHRKKIGESRSGERSNFWRGGVTPWQKKERKSIEYVEWRKAVFERDNYTCQFCSVRGGTLNADHIKPWIAYPELRLELSNGRTLCVPCHKTTPTYAKNYKYQVST